jgi:hypothetical protein
VTDVVALLGYLVMGVIFVVLGLNEYNYFFSVPVISAAVLNF